MESAGVVRKRRRWERKRPLREVYFDLYRKMAAECAPGLTLEVGGGSGNLKDFLPSVISSDVVPAPWLDLVADAQFLPVASGRLANIVMFDVLHHLESPILFLKEAERALHGGGRLVILEPAITPLSWFFYRVIHHEPVEMRWDPFAASRPTINRKPTDSNQAIPTLLFGRKWRCVQKEVPLLHLRLLDWFSIAAYPLTGGFKPWALIPASLVKPVLRCESIIPRSLRRWMAFRTMVVLEKTGATESPRAGGI